MIADLRAKHGLDFEQLIGKIKSYLPEFNAEKFREAFAFAVKAHEGQMRKQANTPYIVHPYETSKILSLIHADETTLIASLLHDVPEDTPYSLDDIQKRFGKKVKYLVEGITKLSAVHYRNDMEEREVESLKKMFIHVAQDPRTMLIKLADRLHNMRTLEYMDLPEKRSRKAKETLEIYAPIAGLLGIKEIQAELEDLCFKFLYLDIYEDLVAKIKQSKERHQPDLEKMTTQIERELKEKGIESIVYSQERSYYEIYKVLLRERKSINDFEHHFKINILVTTVPECYQVLGVVHRLFKPISSSFQDYISVPKSNGYQSLHTSVFGYNGIVSKIHIRTHHMHYEAQYGVAGRYFLKDKSNDRLTEFKDPRSQWVEEVIEIQKDELDREQYLDDLKSDILQDRITVFTPKGKAVDLPQGATCIDFAYNIHSEVGHRSIRAIVNQLNVSLSHELSKGDVVKIITTDYPKSPSYEWLSFAKTTFAKKRMRNYFKKESRTSKIKVGRKMLQKEYDRAGLGLISNISKWRVDLFAQKHPYIKIETLDDVLVHIAEGSIIPLDLLNTIYKDSDINSLQKAKRSLEGIEHKANLLRFNLKIQCESFVDLPKLIQMIQQKKDVIIHSNSELRKDFNTQELTILSTLYAKNYNDISKICSDLEHVDGVKNVKRVFRFRKTSFVISLLATFLIWAIHPLILSLTYNQQNLMLADRIYASQITVFGGVILLFVILFYLKNHTLKTYPDLRENKWLWISAYVLSTFVFLTIIAENIVFDLELNWLLIAGLALGVYSYLLGQTWTLLKLGKKT